MSEYIWLNDLSQQFMEKDYLLPGQTFDERALIIANKAEKDLRMPGFANRFIGYLKQGFYSLSTPIMTNYGTDRGLPIACITGDSWINTRYEGGKQAKDIEIGDLVLTHKGRYRKVTNIMVTQDKDDLYIIKVGGRMTPIKITGNHPVLTNEGWIPVESLNPKRHLVAINRTVDFGQPLDHTIDLKTFVPYVYIEESSIIYKAGSEKVKLSKRKHIVSYVHPIPAKVPVTKDLAWALGLWFAEGSLSLNKGKPVGIRITINAKDEKYLADKWLSIMLNSFNISGSQSIGHNVSHGKDHSWLNANISSLVLGSFFKSFGNGCKEKTLPNWFIDLPNDKLESFLDGVLIGDGSVRPDGSTKITLSNPKLILQIYQIGLKLGRTMSLQMQEKPGVLSSTKYVYTILFGEANSIDTTNNTRQMQFYDGLSYGRIRSLTKTNLVDTVYDFTVEEDHSFSVSGVVVHNCYGSNIQDTMDSILYTHAEVGMMTKYGGGTSAFFGHLRGRGALVKNNGTSSGSVHFMQMYEKLMIIVSQGNTRRGNFVAWLSIDHPDISEFLSIRSEGHPIQDISFGVTVPDYWMLQMIEGDLPKRKIWARVLQQRANVGFPYIMFDGNVAKNGVEVYEKTPIEASNLCVAGDQLAVTNKGIKSALDLYKSGEDLVLFDGVSTVNAGPMKLVEQNAEVFEIITEAGRSHKVTNYHKVKTPKGMVRASSLQSGDRICVQKNKGLFGTYNNPKLAFLLGLFQGDGTRHKDNTMIDIWENDFDLKQEIEDIFEWLYTTEGWDKYKVTVPNRGVYTRSRQVPKFFKQSESENGVKKLRIQSSKLISKGFVKGVIPDWLWSSDEVTQASYLRGLYFADGTITVGSSKGNPLQLSLSSINYSMLQSVQIMLTNLGLSSSIKSLKEECNSLLPDGKGGKKEYPSKKCWRLIISNKPDAIIFNKLTGFLQRKGVIVEDREYRNNTKKYDKVVSVTYVGREDVYCTTVDSDEHVWVCNGFITSNCTEIFLPTNEEESFVCDLSSMNDLYYDQWKSTDAVRILTYFLDAVMTEFIEKASKKPFMERAVRFAKNHRALGIGQLGWHSYLQSKMIPFESMEAKFINVDIAKFIKEEAYSASAELAYKFGPPKVLKDQGIARRNTTLIAIAPTKSTSFIFGQVSEGIEPSRSNLYIKDLAKGKFTIRNPYLIDLLERKGKNTHEVWADVLNHAGSIQHVDFLTHDEKAVFKTFAEISQKEVIIQAAARQQFIDQGQSLNLMIHPSIPVKDVNALYIFAWESGIKSLYYQYSVNAAQEFARNILECSSCSS